MSEETMLFTEMTPEGRKALRERFPELFRERESKSSYTECCTPNNPRRTEDGEGFTVIIRKRTTYLNRRGLATRETVKDTTVRIPAEWVREYRDSVRYRGPLTEMLSFR
jgi:hypothetical protein